MMVKCNIFKWGLFLFTNSYCCVRGEVLTVVSLKIISSAMCSLVNSSIF
jgi:hypothetical protein